MLDNELLKDVKNDEETSNEIIEIDENDEISNTQYDLNEVEDNDKNRKTKKDSKEKKIKKESKWKKLSKKKKIIIIVSIIVLLVAIIGILLYFFVFKKDVENNNDNKEPLVIVENDNYRYEDGTLIFIDENKNELGKYECTNKNENLCYVAYYSNEDEFDVPKNVYENGVQIEFRSDVLANNYVFIYDNTKREDGNIILYNMADEKKVEDYSLVKKVNDEYVIVKNLDNEYALLKFESDKITNAIDFDYDYLGYISDSKYIVGANNNNYILLDMDGSEITKNIPGEIKNYDDKNISVKIDGDYYVYNYQGIRQNEEEYDYIRFVSNYIIAAKSKKLYAFDSEMNPLNLEGIRISSSKYNTELIFNDDLYQTGKEEAFNASLQENKIMLEFDDEIVYINLNEGNYNKDKEYISYFQGKLYFYKDADKKELLGSYACNYANSVDNTTTSLTNCYLAKESNVISGSKDINLGYLPIYNERFVFIADTKNPNANDNIILWDLKQNKKLATYKQVDAGFYNNEKDINFVETGGTIVLAKNTSDSYGLINIESNTVSGIIAFKDDDGNTNVSAKNLNGYILMKRSNGTYHLYDNKGNEITEGLTTKNEIVDYKDNYLLVKSNDNYVIYKLDGSIVSNEYKYIILEKNYYITVDKNNNVGVFTFAKGNVNLAEGKKIVIDGKDCANEIKYGVNGSVLVLTYTYGGQKQVVEINIG